MGKLVTIYGGSGFVGRYVAQRMARAGWRVRVAVRRPNEALFVKPYGVVGQVEPVFCNIRDDDSVRAVMQGADAVVNCVGILNEVGKNSFGLVQQHGAARVARIAAELGVGTLVHLSAIGADPRSDSVYAQTKGRGEEAEARLAGRLRERSADFVGQALGESQRQSVPVDGQHVTSSPGRRGSCRGRSRGPSSPRRRARRRSRG
jgi:uncharacterized protein YbjT (DUF2867 family)